MNAIAERDAAIAERDRLIELNDRLRRLLRKAQGFEAKSERLAKLHPDQLNLALEDIEQTIAKAEAIEEKTQVAAAPRKRRINRGALPAHLPRIHKTVAPADTNCLCCKKPMHVIGEETSERLDVIPAQYRVIVTHRPRLACRACERIVEAPAPEHLIKSGLPTEAMVASVLVAKYGWHLPLYRQAKMLAAQGFDLDRSTLAFWVGYAAAELMPLYERLKATLLISAKLAVDETPVPVLDPGRGKTKTGYFWAIARDDRPWGGTDPPAVAYTYAPGRGGEHLEKLLVNYRGIVQCDGYAPYKKLPAERITVAFCWSHLRREFFKIAERGDAPIATEAVARIAQIYVIEKDVRGTSADERRVAARQRSRGGRVLPKRSARAASRVGKAFRDGGASPPRLSAKRHKIAVADAPDAFDTASASRHEERSSGEERFIDCARVHDLLVTGRFTPPERTAAGPAPASAGRMRPSGVGRGAACSRGSSPVP